MIDIAHIVPHVDEEASGPSQSVVRLCESQADEGVDVRLVCLAAGNVPAGIKMELHSQWRVFGQFGFAPSIVPSLWRHGATLDIIHNHSLWAFPNMVAGLTSRKSGATLITSPRGTLAPAAMARSGLRKSLMKPLQWPTLTRAACLHATSPMEYQDIRCIGLRQPVAVIPNGIDIPTFAANDFQEAPQGLRRLLYLGRLHPIKGVEMLLRVWCELQKQHPGWELVIAGKGKSAYMGSLQAQAAKLNLRRVMFPGPIYGNAKRSLYHSSELFILPTRTENFGMVIAEALAHAVPVVTTRGAPWPGLVTQGCGWWVERNTDELGSTLDAAMRLDKHSLSAMGTRGRDWMSCEFDWGSVARRMNAVYRWLRDGGASPHSVRNDN